MDSMSVIIPRNVTIPSAKEKTYYTFSDYQTEARVKVYQGESQIASSNHFLGEFELSGIPPKRSGKESIRIRFSYDLNGILDVRGTVVSTGQEASIRINMMGPDASDRKGPVRKDPGWEDFDRDPYGGTAEPVRKDPGWEGFDWDPYAGTADAKEHTRNMEKKSSRAGTEKDSLSGWKDVDGAEVYRPLIRRVERALKTRGKTQDMEESRRKLKEALKDLKKRILEEDWKAADEAETYLRDLLMILK